MSDVLNMIEELANERRQSKKEAYEHEQAQKLAVSKAAYDAIMSHFGPVIEAAKSARANAKLYNHVDFKAAFSADGVDIFVFIVDSRTSSRRESYTVRPCGDEVAVIKRVRSTETTTRLAVKDALAWMIDLLAQILSTYKEA